MTSQTNIFPRYRVHPHAAHRCVGGEIFVVTDDRAFHRLLPGTAVDVFQAVVAGTTDAMALAKLIAERYEVAGDRAATDIRSFLDDLVSRRVLEREPT